MSSRPDRPGPPVQHDPDTAAEGAPGACVRLPPREPRGRGRRRGGHRGPDRLRRGRGRGRGRPLGRLGRRVGGVVRGGRGHRGRRHPRGRRQGLRGPQGRRHPADRRRLQGVLGDVHPPGLLRQGGRGQRHHLPLPRQPVRRRDRRVKTGPATSGLQAKSVTVGPTASPSPDPAPPPFLGGFRGSPRETGPFSGKSTSGKDRFSRGERDDGGLGCHGANASSSTGLSGSGGYPQGEVADPVRGGPAVDAQKQMNTSDPWRESVDDLFTTAMAASRGIGEKELRRCRAWRRRCATSRAACTREAPSP